MRECSLLQAFEVDSWPIGPAGFLYDREWMIVTLQGACISQKQVLCTAPVLPGGLTCDHLQMPAMCLIRPHINLEQGTLTLTHPSCSALLLRLDGVVESAGDGTSSLQPATLCPVRVCGDRYAFRFCFTCGCSLLTVSAQRRGA